ncbi:MAG: hypothetical protein SGJ27_20980 [Candidatus Melainabacteria bacterium]|nr:hypothetical protein [Candidatus Melainabacteria bacterium]
MKNEPTILETTKTYMSDADRVAYPRLMAWSSFLFLFVCPLVIFIVWFLLTSIPADRFPGVSIVSRKEVSTILGILAIALVALAKYCSTEIKTWLRWQKAVVTSLSQPSEAFVVLIEKRELETLVRLRRHGYPHRMYAVREVANSNRLSDFRMGEWLDADAFSDPDYGEPVALRVGDQFILLAPKNPLDRPRYFNVLKEKVH